MRDTGWMNRERLKILRSRAGIHPPDRDFVRRMKKWRFSDERLEVYMNWVTDRWEIWRIPVWGTSQPSRLFILPALDARGLLQLEIRYRVHTSRSSNELYQELVKIEQRAEDLRRRERESRIEAITQGCLDFMRGVLKVQVPSRFPGSGLSDSRCA
ncbi:MAG: hypothetical protein JRI22_13990 [Deltaproteobacteria bacterium]|nr:hypothetical protein [Deltaproteobacteria bacterium]